MDLFSHILNLAIAMGFLYPLAFLFASRSLGSAQFVREVELRSRALEDSILPMCTCTAHDRVTCFAGLVSTNSELLNALNAVLAQQEGPSLSEASNLTSEKTIMETDCLLTVVLQSL